jgi:hypothetical protein
MVKGRHVTPYGQDLTLVVPMEIRRLVVDREQLIIAAGHEHCSQR